MKTRFLFILILTACLIPLIALAEPEVVDKIVAKVNDEIILQSEVDEAVGLYFTQAKKVPTDQEIMEAREEYLQQMVENLLLVAEAENAEITVQSSEVNDALEQTIERMRSNFPSQEAFERELEREGLTMVELRRRYREDIRNQLMINRLIDEKIRSQIEVSAQEVRTLYQERKDEIPKSPGKITVSHILIPIEVSEAAETAAQNRAREVQQMAKSGQDFGELAQEYSEGPSASLGGELGFFGEGDMVPEFEKTAFNMEIGDISDPVRTQFGYHIIKLNDRSGDEVSAAHILFKVSPTKEDTLRALEMAVGLYDRIQNGEEFADLARTYSADENTREAGGKLGTYALEDLISPYSEAVTELQVGQVSQPVLGEFGYHLIRVDARVAEQELSFDDVRDQLEEMVRQEKMKKMYDEWIQKLKETNYIEIHSFS